MQRLQPRKFLIAFAANRGGSLPGCDEDGRRMAACLPDFEARLYFDVTRSRVFEVLRELVHELRPGDTVLLYFSGHGGRACFPMGLGPGLPPGLEWSFFVTVDQPEPPLFNSLLAAELSMLVSRCARVTANVVVILDTCTGQDLVRAAVHSKYVGCHAFAMPTHLVADYHEFATYAGWIRSLRRVPRARSVLDDGVVCVSAAGPMQAAHEIDDALGRPGGAFTLELCTLLPEARRARASWQQLVSIVRQRIDDRWGINFQRPEVTGAANRRVFELECVDLTGSTSYFVGYEGTEWIRSGRLHGTSEGDVFVANGAEGFVTLEVEEVRADRSRVADRDGGGEPEPGSLVHPHHRKQRLPVALDPDCPGRSMLVGRIASMMWLRPHMGDEVPAFRLGSHREGIALWSTRGRVELVGDIEQVLVGLGELARASVFESACSGIREPSPLMSWSHRSFVRRGEHEHELADGELVRVGDRVWLELANHSSRQVPALYVNVIECGVDGRLRVLNDPQHPCGVPVREQGRHRALWFPEGPHGRRQVWPAHAPRDGVREVTWYLVASPVPIDLRALTVSARPIDSSGSLGDRTSGEAAAASRIGSDRPARCMQGPEPDIRWSLRRQSFLLAPTLPFQTQR